MVMGSKFVLTGTDNNGFRHRYSIKKNEAFKKAFVKFMVDLDFDEKEMQNILEREFTTSMFVKTEEGEEEIIRKIKIEEVEDLCRHYENKRYDVDVFYGRLRIIIVVRTKSRGPMVRHLEKKAGWIRPIEIKKIKKEREKKGKPKIPLQKTFVGR